MSTLTLAVYKASSISENRAFLRCKVFRLEPMSVNACKLLVLTLFLYSFAAGAQELSPRAYWPAPVGTQIVTAGYSYMLGDIIPDRSLPLTGVDSSINSMILGYRHTLNLWDRTTNITVEAPYIDGTTVGIREDELNLEREYSGVGIWQLLYQSISSVHLP